MASAGFANPFRPGAGHAPPYLAGREHEKNEFLRFLEQDVVLQNVVLTGLRGVGKTVLMDAFKPLAVEQGWFWVGADLSESTSASEERMATRLLADLSFATSNIVVSFEEKSFGGFHPSTATASRRLDYNFLRDFYDRTPGLSSDKLKGVFEYAWGRLKKTKVRGVVFAYDESQNVSDDAEKKEYPVALLLDVFQSIQRKNIPFMLVLAGLPTLFPKLVESRTYAERMFHVDFLDRLNKEASREAIQKPIEDAACPVKMDSSLVERTIEISGGYPYFIQFLGREAYDVVLQHLKRTRVKKAARINIPFEEIVRKLDNDFFAGPWARATDRQRDLLTVVAELPRSDQEFTVQEVVEKSREMLQKPFSASHVNQMFGTLCEAGLVFKNRHGKYSFAVPLLDRFIKRFARNAPVAEAPPNP